MKTKTKPEGVLVLAGLSDPCRDIGTQCRYDLLPIPWEWSTFNASVTRLLKVEKWTIHTEELDPHAHPIGVRCWVCRSPGSQPLQLLMANGWSPAQGEKAAILIDRLSRGAPAVEFVWPVSNPADAEAIAALEKLLSHAAK